MGRCLLSSSDRRLGSITPIRRHLTLGVGMGWSTVCLTWVENWTRRQRAYCGGHTKATSGCWWPAGETAHLRTIMSCMGFSGLPAAPCPPLIHSCSIRSSWQWGGKVRKSVVQRHVWPGSGSQSLRVSGSGKKEGSIWHLRFVSAEPRWKRMGIEGREKPGQFGTFYTHNK